MITKMNEIKHYGSSGIVFYYNNMILLVKPTVSKRRIYDGWSYPKGRIELNEKKNDAAIREVNEEIKINLPNNFLDGISVKELPSIIKIKGIKHYYYYEYVLTESEFVKYFKEQLQLDEIEQAKFVSLDDAKNLLSNSFKKLLY